ncbi:MAG: DNA mismatch repair endonuclease MutH [Rickettsiales bacterium]|nr:DNA mismatch repair endonuclease MutH [Rickettsiales bacterium]|tara:strand:+ start:1098 stop:1772 length:675 start_codon:yes stop_codon:yes gene_type:complete
MDAPANPEALMQRARSLAGRSLAWIAAELDQPVPDDLRRHKGWAGQLLERALGASGGSRAEPDFPHLGIELKSIPVGTDGRPRESTWVCVAPLDGSLAPCWQDSWVRRKLASVLWLPVLASAGQPPGERRVGTALLWSPSAEEDRLLERDYEELAELICTGALNRLDAHQGEALQLRPKAANSRELVWMLDEQAQWVEVNPRGFYLRRTFTEQLLSDRLLLPST